MRLLAGVLGALLAACAPRVARVGAEHPASPEAAVGRLAGPPAALRPGVVDLSVPVKPVETRGGGGAAADPHAGHGQSPPATPAATEPEPPAATEPEPAATKPPAKKPPAKKPPAQKPPPKKPTATPTPTPPPVDHGAHGGGS